MTVPPNWPEIERLFFAALEVPEAEREAWIDDNAGSGELAGEVRSLIRAHEDSERPMPLRMGPYRLERLLNRGGMGEVWLASRADGQFEQNVALKLVRSGPGSDWLLPRFHQERQMLARLNHPNIARLLDGGISENGRPYLAMEYVEGEPILEFCERRNLAVPARLKMFRELCSAVEYAHRNLIVHRDIKPANVLVTADGTPKLLDFGIAKLLESDVTSPTTLPLLTARYASPEQLRGEPVTTASDVYSLGVLLFELLTGAWPYETRGFTASEIITAITAQDARTASQVNRELVAAVSAGDLDAITAKALEKDPARRYSSVESFSEDIRNYLEGLPVRARPMTRAYRAQRYVRRHWVGVTAVSTIVLALTVATVISIRAARSANRERDRSERVTHFLEDVLTAANPGNRTSGLERNGDLKVVDVMAAASSRLSDKFADDPGVQAELHAAIGRTYIGLGKIDAAQPEVRMALDHLSGLDARPGEKARALHVVARLNFEMGDLKSGEAREREALAVFAHSPDAKTDIPMYSTMLNNLGMFLRGRGKTREAQEAFTRAVSLLDSLPVPPAFETGVLHNNISLLASGAGDLPKAREELRLAIKRLSSLPDPPVNLAMAESNLGFIDRVEGRFEAGIPEQEQALDRAIHAGGMDHPITVGTRIELDLQRLLAGRVTGLEANRLESDLASLVELSRRPGNQNMLALALEALGRARTLAGRASDAEPLLRQAVERRRNHTDFAYNIAMAEEALGECLEQQNKVAEARPLYQAAYERLKKLLGPDAYATRQAAEHLTHVTEAPR